jgi:hypothetical protein
MNSKNALLIIPAVLFVLSGCASTSEQPSTSTALQSFINQYPTRERVDYVLSCVAKHGGLTYISQYACGCKLDKIAEKLSFADYEEAVTYGFMSKTPGEGGAAFRDPMRAKSLKKRFKEAEDFAESSCFIQ